jgi:hypothetical protein
MYSVDSGTQVVSVNDRKGFIALISGVRGFILTASGLFGLKYNKI